MWNNKKSAVKFHRTVFFNENNQLKWWLPMRQGLGRKSAVGFEIVFC